MKMKVNLIKEYKIREKKILLFLEMKKRNTIN